MRKIITCTWLESRGACASELIRFREEFGERLYITYENVYRLAWGKYDINWLMDTISPILYHKSYYEYIKLYHELWPGVLGFGVGLTIAKAEAFWCIWNKYQDQP